MNQASLFSNFTNLYSLSKTLRFELKPVGDTQKILDQNHVFDDDEKIAKNYKEAKKWFNKVHREFIDASLKQTTISNNLLEDYEKKWKLPLRIHKNRRRIFWMYK